MKHIRIFLIGFFFFCLRFFFILTTQHPNMKNQFLLFLFFSFDDHSLSPNIYIYTHCGNALSSTVFVVLLLMIVCSKFTIVALPRNLEKLWTKNINVEYRKRLKPNEHSISLARFIGVRFRVAFTEWSAMCPLLSRCMLARAYNSFDIYIFSLRVLSAHTAYSEC